MYLHTLWMLYSMLWIAVAVCTIKLSLYTVGTKNKPKLREREPLTTRLVWRKKNFFEVFVGVICLHMWVYLLPELPSPFTLTLSFQLLCYSSPSFITPEWGIKKRIFIKLFITCYTTESYHVLRIKRYRIQQAKTLNWKYVFFFLLCHSKIRKVTKANMFPEKTMFQVCYPMLIK